MIKKMLQVKQVRFIKPEHPGAVRFQPRTAIELLGPDGTELEMTIPGEDRRWIEVCADAAWLTLTIEKPKPPTGPRPFGKFTEYELADEVHTWAHAGHWLLRVAKTGLVLYAAPTVTGADIDEARRQIKEMPA